MNLDNNPNIEAAYKTVSRLETELKTIIRGRDDTIKLLLTALFADGHALLEDYPGSGKTTLSKALGSLISSDASILSKGIAPFRRIQFTPDLLPGDVLGVNIFEPASGKFEFHRGPVFAQIVLADEINRTGPKVQAAFLECMAEKQVTIDNHTYPLDDLFFVIGTQNPLDVAGTYPLPIVQLDRFLLKIPMTYVSSEVELDILDSHQEITRGLNSISPICSRNDIIAARNARFSVSISQSLRRAIVDIVQATRQNPHISAGASTRAAIMLQEALRSFALVNGKNYASEDDLKYLTPYVLEHRMRFHVGAGEPKAVLDDLMRPALERLIRSAA